MKDFFKKIKENEEGQAMFELVLFVPIMVYLGGLIMNFGNSINASINQQKATRGYSYYLLNGNSNGLADRELKQLPNLSIVSNNIIGWRFQEEGNGSISFGSFYRLPNVPFAGSDAEDCLEKYSENQTSCIKIFTLYGVCGETYARMATDNSFFRVDYPGNSVGYSSKSICAFK
ncbi:hypothetical protein [Bacteriovorax sp. Seq25_V]|uniref:hypothetical protein n=1 Tax=Bacteriovorax sp. Seq25_V TaxID=1201288 RepID=UPI00038A394A|nr:hypothetical protein [Bacteriovorax sp. Seq25_V]EQC43484.1 hypothetical protein M900_0241 [Bacteriovorax sp. Seq25_V]